MSEGLDRTPGFHQCPLKHAGLDYEWEVRECDRAKCEWWMGEEGCAVVVIAKALQPDCERAPCDQSASHEI